MAEEVPEEVEVTEERVITVSPAPGEEVEVVRVVARWPDGTYSILHIDKEKYTDEALREALREEWARKREARARVRRLRL